MTRPKIIKHTSTGQGEQPEQEAKGLFSQSFNQNSKKPQRNFRSASGLMNQFVKSILMNYRISSLNSKKKAKKRQGTNIYARTIPVLLQNLKGENRRTGTVKGLRGNVHRIKNTNHERPMFLSKSANLVIIIARKVSKTRQTKATTVTGQVSRTEKLGARISNQRNAKNWYLIQVILAGSCSRTICNKFHSRYVSSYSPCCPSSSPEITC